MDVEKEAFATRPARTFDIEFAWRRMLEGAICPFVALAFHVEAAILLLVS